MGSVSPARIVASLVLMEVDANPASDSSDQLDREISKRNLSPQDARLATALVMATLRHRIFLDYQYRPFLTQSPSRLSPALRTIFRMAAAQKFLFERIPDHAIANDMVELGRRQLRLHDRDTRFANAVLRKLLALSEPRKPESSAEEKRVIQYSHPAWILNILDHKYGTASDEVAAKNNTEPRLTLRVNRLRSDVASMLAQLAAIGIEAVPGSIVPEAIIVQGASAPEVAATDAFRDGLLYFQDEASQLVAHLANPKPGERILDLCSAPGGKATHMAELANGQAQILAADISADRLKLVQANVQRLLSPGVQVTQLDELPEADEFDLILVDAPCSGLGTFRRNPEIRYRCSPQSITALASRQLELLKLSARKVRPGGRLVYSTCTISDAENSGVITEFLSQNPDFSLSQSDTTITSIHQLCQTDRLYRTWPTHLEMDGFEAAVLKSNTAYPVLVS